LDTPASFGPQSATTLAALWVSDLADLGLAGRVAAGLLRRLWLFAAL